MKNAILKYLEKRPPALELFCRLEKIGDIYLIGGVLREYQDYQEIRNLRDVDIIVDVKDVDSWRNLFCNYECQCNRFGGNKLICSGLLVDIWAIEDTWAYRESIITCSKQDYVKRLPETVFLNIDSIIYDWEREKWYNKLYKQAMASKTLDVVLPENPQLLLNIVRALVLGKRYDMVFSKQLQNIICGEYRKAKNVNQFSTTLFNEQLRRYLYPIIAQEEIESILLSLIKSSK